MPRSVKPEKQQNYHTKIRKKWLKPNLSICCKFVIYFISIESYYDLQFIENEIWMVFWKEKKWFQKYKNYLKCFFSLWCVLKAILSKLLKCTSNSNVMLQNVKNQICYTEIFMSKLFNCFFFVFENDSLI